MNKDILQLILTSRKKQIGHLEPSLFGRISKFTHEDSDFAQNLDKIEKMSLDELVQERVGRTREVKVERLDERKNSPFFIPSLRDFGLARRIYERVMDLPYIGLCVDADDVYASLILIKIPQEHAEVNGFKDKCKISSIVDYALLRLKLGREKDLMQTQKQERDRFKGRMTEEINGDIIERLTLKYGTIAGELEESATENIEQRVMNHFDNHACVIRSYYEPLAIEESRTLSEERASLAAVRRNNFEVGDNVELGVNRSGNKNYVSGQINKIRSYFWGSVNRIHVTTKEGVVKVFANKVKKKITPIVSDLIDQNLYGHRQDYDDIDLVLPKTVREIYLRRLAANGFNTNFVREVISGNYQEQIRAVIREATEGYKEKVQDYSAKVSNTTRRVKRIELYLKTFERELSKKR